MSEWIAATSTSASVREQQHTERPHLVATAASWNGDAVHAAIAWALAHMTRGSSELCDLHWRGRDDDRRLIVCSRGIRAQLGTDADGVADLWLSRRRVGLTDTRTTGSARRAADEQNTAASRATISECSCDACSPCVRGAGQEHDLDRLRVFSVVTAVSACVCDTGTTAALAAAAVDARAQRERPVEIDLVPSPVALSCWY